VTAPPAQALFQVAAILIPALLLAGGLVRQTDEALTKWYAKPIGVLMVLVVIAAVGGELVAINSAFAVSSSEPSIRFVVGVLAVGTIAIADTVHDAQAAQALTALQAASDAEQAAHGRAARDAARVRGDCRVPQLPCLQ